MGFWMARKMSNISTNNFLQVSQEIIEGQIDNILILCISLTLRPTMYFLFRHKV